ncbi:Ceramide synthase hyl-1 [Orchesella cincta]|uniref:Ceramide synthase hyl-1 n=1 Tax=Orchesella cincta TaxID=48709 RepID=A0A1D2N9P3_ORCCI|nr:Ceramide synthase hyl-1 [Orchesella cincta]
MHSCFAVLWNKTWFMDVEECWKGYPYHSITDDVWWYNTFGGSLYCSFLMTQAFDVKRKDFWEMLIHHVITIVLMGLAWTHNLFKLGMLTLLLHDCSDVFIESAKMANYSKRDNLATGIFVVFTMVWVVTRLIIFPGKIMKSCLESPHFLALPSAPRNIITGLIIFLLCLHLFWTYFIVKVAKAALSSEKTKDARSSSESESDSEIEEEGNKGKNGLAVIQNFHSRQGTQRRHSIQYDNLVFDEIQATKRAFIKRLSVEWT